MQGECHVKAMWMQCERDVNAMWAQCECMVNAHVDANVDAVRMQYAGNDANVDGNVVQVSDLFSSELKFDKEPKMYSQSVQS